MSINAELQSPQAATAFDQGWPASSPEVTVTPG